MRSALTFGLLATLGPRRLRAAGPRASIVLWFEELAQLTADLRAGRIADLRFQGGLEALYRRVDLQELIGFVALDQLKRTMQAPPRGAATRDLDLRAALPDGARFDARIFTCARGRAIVPHGHDNMCSGFVVLRGRWRGRHYDRVESRGDHHIIRPTIDRELGPGELTTISDHRDNVHWFEAGSDDAWIFNVHVGGYDPASRRAPGRLYLDPDGERLAGGLIRAARMSPRACHDKYG